MNTIETISALCTIPGGAISIIRISGKDAVKLGNAVWKGKSKLSAASARTLHFGHCYCSGDKNGDPALAVFMKGPHTYTGEDVVELHCHGGALVSKNILDALINAGARPAEPGEFTFRAFMNSKMDLTQAEAVGDIISAHSDMALNLAERQMAGNLGEEIRDIRVLLLEILSECESRLDFSEEDLDWKKTEVLCKDLNSAVSQINTLLTSSREGAVLRDGVRIVIAGRPNVGKSSLLNLLLGYDRAIVTELPGTTRDTLEEYATIRGIPVKMIDTAGIREADNLIEGIGIERSFASLDQAQVIIWLMDASADLPEEFAIMREHTGERYNVISLWNKIDLLTKDVLLPGIDDAKQSIIPVLKLSVEKSKGIEEFLDAIENCVWRGQHHGDSEMAVSSRHAALLDNALKQLLGTDENITLEEWELVAVDLRGAIFALGTITGEDADPDVLDDIFSRFCIGK